MWWLIGIAVVVGVGWFLVSRAKAGDDEDAGSSYSRASYEDTYEPPKADRKTARQIAAEIDTLEKYRELDRRLQAALDDPDPDEDFELLDKAPELASEKTLLWQYTPWVTPTTPLNVLNRVYSTCSPAEFKAMKAKLGAELEDWVEVTGDPGPDEPDEHFRFLLAFRQIAESEVAHQTRLAKINELVAQHADVAKTHFDLESDLAPSDQWLADSMEADGLPRARELYAEGYTTPEKCLEIDLKEFRGRKGVGPKTVEALRGYQEKVRQSIHRSDGTD